MSDWLRHKLGMSYWNCLFQWRGSRKRGRRTTAVDELKGGNSYKKSEKDSEVEVDVLNMNLGPVTRQIT